MKLNPTSDPTRDTARRAFVADLRRALHHLYDAIELRKSALLPLFGLSGPAGVTALRQILEDAIDGLKPGPGVSAQSDAWRTYRALCHRYIEQFDQASVATNLGLSVRQLRRQERLALHTLADRLIERYHLTIASDFGRAANDEPAGLQEDNTADALREDDDAEETAQEAAGIDQELKWAEQTFPSQPLAVDEIVRSALQTVKPMMDGAGVTAQCEIPAGLPRALAAGVSVRQALLNLLIAATRSTADGKVRVACGGNQSSLWVSVAPLALPGSPHDSILDVAAQLAEIAGGYLERERDEAGRSARLVLPTAGQLSVLVIDDNADSLRLFERYLADSRYQLIGARDPSQALALAEQIRPRVIVLDVMLPGIDGWEVLGRLRENPVTRDIPVLVCTILPQEDLALTLGAAAFLRKPVSREHLLAALDQQAQPEGTTAG
jgi:CheY-like chemotaxis protein